MDTLKTQLPSNSFPRIRKRRTRRTAFLRDLVQETQLTPKDLILPVFVHDKSEPKTAISTLPNTYRFSIEQLLKECERILAAGIPAIAIFPAIEADQKTLLAEEAFNPQGLVQRTVRAVKQQFPQLGVITDVALDPYTIHGQDGILGADGDLDNDITIETLAKQALSHADAGADILAPSDMMDGRVGYVRDQLEHNDHQTPAILSYSSKFASAFYGPFRDAVGSAGQLGKADKKTYQINPANGVEAVAESLLDISEGADILMVKPGMPYLDILYRVKQASQMPIFVYHVSGEYAMLKLAIQNGLLPQEALMETMIGFKRAGADAILTYAAHEVAQLLQGQKS